MVEGYIDGLHFSCPFLQGNEGFLVQRGSGEDVEATMICFFEPASFAGLLKDG